MQLLKLTFEDDSLEELRCTAVERTGSWLTCITRKGSRTADITVNLDKVYYYSVEEVADLEGV